MDKCVEPFPIIENDIMFIISEIGSISITLMEYISTQVFRRNKVGKRNPFRSLKLCASLVDHEGAFNLMHSYICHLHPGVRMRGFQCTFSRVLVHLKDDLLLVHPIPTA